MYLANNATYPNRRQPNKYNTSGGITGVYFESNGGRLQTSNAATLINSATIWGNSDWSVEAWYLHDGRENSCQCSLFQWGPLSGPSGGACTGAFLAIGSHPQYGAGEQGVISDF